MSHNTSLRQLLSSTGHNDQESNARSLRSNAAGGAAGDVSLKKDFVVTSVNSPIPQYHDIPGGKISVAGDHLDHHGQYGYNLGVIAIELKNPNSPAGEYSHITVKLYDDTGSVHATTTGRHGQVVVFRDLDAGNNTSWFKLYTIELINTNGGMGQRYPVKLFNTARSSFSYKFDASNQSWVEDGVFNPQVLGYEYFPGANNDPNGDKKVNVPGEGLTDNYLHYVFDLPHITGDSITKNGITLPSTGSVTISPFFGGEGPRFTEIKKRSEHYTWAKISGNFTTTEVTLHGIPAFQLTSNLTTPGIVTRGEVSIQYSDEFNTDASKYDTLIKVPVTSLGGDIPGIAAYATPETYSVYHNADDAAVYVVGISPLTPTTTNWRVTLLNGGTVISQTTKSGQWFFNNPVSFTNLSTVEDTNADGTPDSDPDVFYTVRVEDVDTGAKRELAVDLRQSIGSDRHVWSQVVAPIPAAKFS
ncbi:hypothetical protein H8E06_01130 [bacterium]|nr:hypothetical protein [bacterium]